jgi:hypothetical protein
MTRLSTRVLRALAVAGATALFSACSTSATESAPQRSIHAVSRSGDDLPPDTPCRSGWINVEGRWVCGDP